MRFSHTVLTCFLADDALAMMSRDDLHLTFLVSRGWFRNSLFGHFSRCGCGCGFRGDLEIPYRVDLVDPE